MTGAISLSRLHFYPQLRPPTPNPTVDGGIAALNGLFSNICSTSGIHLTVLDAKVLDKQVLSYSDCRRQGQVSISRFVQGGAA